MRRRSNAVVMAAALVILSATPRTAVGAPPQASGQSHAGALPAALGAEDYKIGAEDVLDISVWRNADLTRAVQVRPDGRISLPLVGELQASGLTPTQLQAILAKGYVKYFTDLEITVGVREVHSNKISVLGTVKTPGRFELRSQATVLDGLALAGGFADFAKRDKVFVIRGFGPAVRRLAFNYLKLLAGQDAENFLLQAGDVIIVP